MANFRDIDIVLADAATKMCIEVYDRLPKSGKPTATEWTIVAAVIEEIGLSSRIISLGTGSKCLGKNSLSSQGHLVNDSHAEVIARRNFLLYLYCEIILYNKEGKSEVLEESVDGKLKVKKNVRFGFVSSVVPCGDAAIIPVNETSQLLAADNSPQDSTAPPRKRQRTVMPEIGDIHRTGAKCLTSEEKQDLKLPGAQYHVLGALRTKPGRGDPTASVSCSDKLARWNIVGAQGALLSILLEGPICFEYIIIGGRGPFCEFSIERAINERVGTPTKTPIIQSNLSFPHDRSDQRARPSPSSISWNIRSKQPQVCVEGRRLGATKKNSSQFVLDISKLMLFRQFLEAIESNEKLLDLRQRVSNLTYRQLKELSLSYQSSWKALRMNYFRTWTTKPDGMEDFHANVCTNVNK